MILPDADRYTKHTNTVVLPHNCFATLKHTYNKTSLVGGTSLYFHMWLLSAGWNLDKLNTANLADFTETLPKTSPELKSYCLCFPLQDKRGQPYSASGQNLFPAASKIHRDSIQRSAATVFNEECTAVERQCCHCDPLPLLGAISPLFPLKMRKCLRPLKWKLPLNPNHPKA